MVMDFEDKKNNLYLFSIRLFNLIKASFLLADALNFLRPDTQVFSFLRASLCQQ